MGKIGNLGKRKNIESREGAETQRKEKNLKRERLKNWIPQRG